MTAQQGLNQWKVPWETPEMPEPDTTLINLKTLHGTTDGVMRRRRSAFSTCWLGDDMRFPERPGETSPPFPDAGMVTGDRMREDWFPVLWRRRRRAGHPHSFRHGRGV